MYVLLMNSSKILFVGRYAKSPKKSSKKSARSSKTKYEDISLGTVMRTSKSRNTDVKTGINANMKREHKERPSLENIKKINSNKPLIKRKPVSANTNYTGYNSQDKSKNYRHKDNPLQSKNNKISIRKIAKKPSSSLIEKNKQLISTHNTFESRKSNSLSKTKKPIQKMQKTERAKKSKTNKISCKSRSKKQKSSKNEKCKVVNTAKSINVHVNPDLYLRIKDLFYPYLFVKSSDNFKFFSNFDLHDKYLASVISNGVMIRKYS